MYDLLCLFQQNRCTIAYSAWSITCPMCDVAASSGGCRLRQAPATCGVCNAWIRQCNPTSVILYSNQLKMEFFQRTGNVPMSRASIFKKESKSDVGNYRPVSLAPVPCKILKLLIIRDTMVKYMDNNEFISTTQHGFVSNRSCLTNLL